MRKTLGELVFVSITLSFFVSCGDDSESTDSSIKDFDYVSESEPLFSLDQLMRVNIEMDSRDWDTLRYESPGLDHYVDTECPNGPRPRPFHWYNATATVNDEDFGAIEIRKKGFRGSMEPMTPSVKLRFDDNRRAWGIRRMTLNNTISDSTWSRQCLAYHLFRKADLAAPRCGLAQLTVNGHDLGIYTHIEEIRTPLLKSQFEDDDGDGDLYELTGADFLPDLLVMFEDKENNGKGDLSYLKKLADALETDEYDTLLQELGKYIDLDDFFTYWAMEAVTLHWDSYSGNRNNCYLYRDSAHGLFHFIPWGTDAAFAVLEPAEGVIGPEDYWAKFLGRDRLIMPWAVYAHGEIARRLYAYPEGRARYETRLRELLEDVWDETELIDMVDTIVKTISPKLTDRLRDRTRGSATYLKEEIIKQHQSRIMKELDSGLEDWDLPRNPPLCAQAVTDADGDSQTNRIFEGTIQTQFSTHSDDMIASISDDNQVVEIVSGQVTTMAAATGVVDYDEDTATQWRNILLIIAFGPSTKDGDYAWFEILFPEELFYTGNTIRLDYGQGRTEVSWLDGQAVTELVLNPTTGTEPKSTPAGFVCSGEMTLDEVDATSGGTVKLSFKAPLVELKVPSE